MRRLSMWVWVFCVLVPAGDAVAQRSLPMSLDRMVRQSGVIVHGRIVSTETGRDPRTGLPATWTTVEVRENFYGATGSTVRYKQFGGTVDGIVTPTPDLPRLANDEEVILLLYPASEAAGFQSPVGLGQGVFRVKAVRSGKRVSQFTRTAQLMKGGTRAPLSADREGSYDLDAFAKSLRSLVREVKP